MSDNPTLSPEQLATFTALVYDMKGGYPLNQLRCKQWWKMDDGWGVRYEGRKGLDLSSPLYEQAFSFHKRAGGNWQIGLLDEYPKRVRK